MDRLSIGAVAKLTGLTEFTLRAWERRHNVTHPHRSPTGRRLYSEKDVERLQLIRNLIDQGHTIRDLAALEVSKLKALTLATAKTNTKVPRADALDELESSLRQMDLSNFSELLKSSQMKLDTRSFLLELVAPFMRRLGTLVFEGDLDIFHEHAASAIVRNILTGLLFSTENSTRFKDSAPIVFSTPEDDHHEFGILIASILCVLNRKRVFYLGPNMPALSLVKAGEATGSTHYVTGISAPMHALSTKQLSKYITELVNLLPTHATLWLAGERSYELQNHSKVQQKKVKFIKSLEQFERSIL